MKCFLDNFKLRKKEKRQWYKINVLNHIRFKLYFFPILLCADSIDRPIFWVRKHVEL